MRQFDVIGESLREMINIVEGSVSYNKVKKEAR